APDGPVKCERRCAAHARRQPREHTLIIWTRAAGSRVFSSCSPTQPMTHLEDDLLAYCHSQRLWLQDVVESLVRLESPSDDKAAVDLGAAELASVLTRIGGRVSRVPQEARGDHVRAEWDGEGPRVLLLGHF